MLVPEWAVVPGIGSCNAILIVSNSVDLVALRSRDMAGVDKVELAAVILQFAIEHKLSKCVDLFGSIDL